MRTRYSRLSGNFYSLVVSVCQSPLQPGVNFLYFNTRVFDVDGTGRVSAAELREVLTSLGEKLTEEEVEELFSEGEVDEDGMIDYHTICQAVLQ